MKLTRCLLPLCLGIMFGVVLNAQEPAASQSGLTASPVVPRLVNFSGKATDAQGKAISSVTSATFAVYRDQHQGAPLWMETQSIHPDQEGKYDVQLGATKSEGLPLELFTSPESRWLGVRINGGEEQPRVLLVSVPYALKAADADTLGGKPISAFQLAPESNGAAPGNNASSNGPQPNIGEQSNEIVCTSTTACKSGFIPLFSTTGGSAKLTDSLLSQSGTTVTVSGSETVSGNVSGSQLVSTVATGTSPFTVSSTTQVTNLNASLLGGLSASAFPLLASPNTFTSTNTFTANASGSPIVFGTNTSTTGGFADGVHGVANSPGSSGVAGVNASGALGSIGVYGTSGGFGIYGTSTGSPTSGPVAGVLGQIGASGAALAGSFIGVWGDTGVSSGYGVFGSAGGSGLDGVHGISSNASGSGVAGVNFGTGDGVFGGQSGGYAGYFSGNVNVTGNLSKGGGSFKIDHPLDPANKYLYHSFVESPDMMNIYNGNVTTDAEGNATVALPEWFEVLNRDFRYQLTVIGQFAQAIVSSEIANRQFSIKTDKPNVKVSWQVTGIRQDAWANAHRIPVEEMKPEGERGFYLHPELFGAALEEGIAARRHPTYMQMPAKPSTLRQDNSANH